MGAFAEGNILQVLFFSMLFGLSRWPWSATAGQPVLTVLESTAKAVLPPGPRADEGRADRGVRGLRLHDRQVRGIGSIANLAALVATFYLTSLVFVLVVLGLVARANGFSIFKLIRYLKAELLLVLGTSSSEAALPSLIEKLEKAGCPKSVVGLVVPLGYSFNLDGTNIYMTLAALFIAQACSVHLSWSDQALLLGVAMLSSKGAAGVTGAGFITLAATLSVVPSVPVAGMALILGVDRFMTECRALTNFTGNAVATMVVSRWEKGLDAAQLEAALNPEPVAPEDPGGRRGSALGPNRQPRTCKTRKSGSSHDHHPSSPKAHLRDRLRRPAAGRRRPRPAGPPTMSPRSRKSSSSAARSRRAKTTAALPVTVMDNTQIAATGAVSGDDLFRSIPIMGDVFINPSNAAQTSNSTRGDVNSINLRSLGVGNTLVLLNGRRLVRTRPASRRAPCRCWATTPTPSRPRTWSASRSCATARRPSTAPTRWPAWSTPCCRPISTA